MSTSPPPPRGLLGFLRRTIAPLLLIVLCPPTVILMWHTNVALDGSFALLGHEFGKSGVFPYLWSIWEPVFFGTPAAWTIIGVFAASQLALMRLLPGARFEGPVTPAGNIPVYKANGVLAFVVTMAAFAICSWGLALFSPAVVYDHFGGILGALNIFSLGLCAVLYFKGRFAPSSTDSGHTGNPIFDYYWGTELYPRVLGWDLKMFTNCRFGMMAWPVIIVSFAAKQHELYGISDSMLVSVGLQLIYVAKFYYWETGYLRSLDIMHDRAGFYIVWGVLVWIAGFYASPTLYLVHHPNDLGLPLALGIAALGVLGIFTNYFADAQRQRVRATNGETTVWGKPPEVIVAHYTTERGEAKQSLLLVSGWWGISRHFHYLPEILGALCWTLPALFHHLMPYCYVIFLTILLTERAFRDDRRCAAKYGPDWDRYCQRVRWKIIPGLV